MSGLSLVFDFMPNTLYGRLRDENNPMSRQEVKKYMNMLLKGIEYLHSMGIMHRVCVFIYTYITIMYMCFIYYKSKFRFFELIINYFLIIII